jgi:hypothetical protein
VGVGAGTPTDLHVEVLERGVVRHAVQLLGLEDDAVAVKDQRLHLRLGDGGGALVPLLRQLGRPAGVRGEGKCVLV